MALDALIYIALLVSICLLVTSVLLLKRATKLYRATRELLKPKERSAKRIRKRYIVFSVLCESRAKSEEVHKAIEKAFLEYYGKSAFHKASPYLVLFDEASQRGIYRVSHMFVDHVIASMGLIKEINSSKCIIVPLRTTGSLKKAGKYIKRPKP